MRNGIAARLQIQLIGRRRLAGFLFLTMKNKKEEIIFGAGWRFGRCPAVAILPR
jgi:hypothetical protein